MDPEKAFVWHGSHTSNELKQMQSVWEKHVNKQRVFTIDVRLPPSYVIDICAIDQSISFCYLVSFSVWIFLQE